MQKTLFLLMFFFSFFDKNAQNSFDGKNFKTNKEHRFIHPIQSQLWLDHQGNNKRNLIENNCGRSTEYNQLKSCLKKKKIYKQKFHNSFEDRKKKYIYFYLPFHKAKKIDIVERIEE